VALAEREAREHLDAVCDVPPAIVIVHGTTPDAVMRRTVAARLVLLSDLSRPASRDAVARLVAEKVDAPVWDIVHAIEAGDYPKLEAFDELRRYVIGWHCRPEVFDFDTLANPAGRAAFLALAVLGAPHA
jgi:hypothetical protein